jgi:DHA1 family multidrug resistance protein-like MFS transporter
VETWRTWAHKLEVRNLVAVTSAAFVGFIGFTLVMPFLPLYLQQLGVTDTRAIALWAGATLGITPAISALCAPLWGRVGDRFGNKLLVQRTLLGGIVVLILMAQATQAWHLLVLRAVQGLIAGYAPLTLAMAASSVPPERMARAIATVQTAQRMGPAIGPVIGGVLASVAGLRNVFFIAAGVYALAAGIMAFLYVEPRGRSEVARRERLPFRAILAFDNFLILMVVIFGLQLVDKSFGPVLLLHLDQLGYSAGDSAVLAGVLFSLLAVSAAAGNQVAAFLLKTMSPRSVIDTAAIAGAAALTLFALRPETGLMLAAMAIVGLSIGAAMTTSFTAAGSVLPRHAHGAGFGFLGSASLTGFAMSPIVSGIIAGRSIRAVFFSCVGVLLVMALIVRRVMVETPPRVEAAPAIEES